MNLTSARIAGATFGGGLLVALVLLGDLLGSSADSTAAFTEQFDDTATRIGHIVGALALLVSAVALLVFGLAYRRQLHATVQALSADVVAGLSALSSAGLLVSASLVSAPALMKTLGETTDDPGIEPNAAAGIAQAGTVVLVFTLLVAGLMTILVVRLARQQLGLNRAMLVAAWFVSLLTVTGLAIATLFPFALIWLGLGIWLRPSRRT